MDAVSVLLSRAIIKEESPALLNEINVGSSETTTTELSPKTNNKIPRSKKRAQSAVSETMERV